VFLDVYTLYSLLGMGMIILGLVLNARYKKVKGRDYYSF